MRNIKQYNKVPTLKILYALKNHQENEIIYCEETSKLYRWNNEEWTPIETKNEGVKINLYELNKNIVNQLAPFTVDDLSAKIDSIEKYFQESYDKHYMLLCSEYNYYTIFEADSTLSLPTFSGALCSTLLDLGDIFSIERTEDGYALEIWLKPHNENSPMVFYLFPYDKGVIYYG